MAVGAIEFVLIHCKQKGAKKLMLIGIANHICDRGSAYPSIETLATYASVSPRSAQRIITELEFAGELNVWQAAGWATPKGKTNKYWLTQWRISKGYRVPLDVAPPVPRQVILHTHGQTYDNKILKQIEQWRKDWGVTDVTPNKDGGVTVVTPKHARGVIYDAFGVSRMTPKPSLKPSSPSKPSDKSAAENRKASVLIQKWLEIFNVIDPDAQDKYNKIARAMVKQGIEVANLIDYCKHLKGESFWQDKTPKFDDYIATNIQSWLKSRNKPAEPTPPKQPAQAGKPAFKRMFTPNVTLEGLS